MLCWTQSLVGEIPNGDTSDYDEIAINLLLGKGFVATGNWFGFELRSWRPPLYPMFLASLYGLKCVASSWEATTRTDAVGVDSHPGVR